MIRSSTLLAHLHFPVNFLPSPAVVSTNPHFALVTTYLITTLPISFNL